jgi:penicillin-binding protein 1A
VGFNDSRVQLNDYWGQGARSALPVVAEVAAASQRAKLVQAQARFEMPAENNTFVQRLRSWMLGFGGSKEPVDPFEQPPAMQPLPDRGNPGDAPVIDDPEARPIGQGGAGPRGPSGEGDYPVFQNNPAGTPQVPTQRPTDPGQPQPGVVVPGTSANPLPSNTAPAAPATSFPGSATAPQGQPSGNPPPIERGVVVSPVSSGAAGQPVPTADGGMVWRRATPSGAVAPQSGNAGIAAGEIN